MKSILTCDLQDLYQGPQFCNVVGIYAKITTKDMKNLTLATSNYTTIVGQLGITFRSSIKIKLDKT